MSSTVRCWFDYSSPFAYLGTTQIEAVAAEAGAEVVFEPFLLGALFKRIGTPLIPLHSFADSKQRHMRADLHRHADVYGVPFHFTTHFPLRSVDALRLTLAVARESRAAIVHELMRASWVRDEDIAQRGVLERCVADAGLDSAVLARISEPEVKAQLRQKTERAYDLGLPGAPCFEVGPHIYWGQDRLDLVRRALAGTPPRETEAP